MNSISPHHTALYEVSRPDVAPRAIPLRVVPLSETLSAVFFDTTADHAVHGAELVGTSGTEALERPLIVTQLARVSSGARCLFLLSRPAADLCRDGLEICRDGVPVAALDPLSLQSPIVDPLALMTGLSPEGGRRLLKLLLTTGLSLFGQRAYAGFREIVSQLLASLTPPPLQLQAICPVGTSACIASYVLPNSTEANDLNELVVLDQGQVQRIPEFTYDVETQPTGGEILHLTLPIKLRPGAVLVALAETPFRLSGPEAQDAARPLGPWLERRSVPIRRSVRKTLQKMAVQEPSVAALLEEISCPAQDQPRAMPRFLAGTAKGLLYGISLSDPRNLISRLVLGGADIGFGIPVGRVMHHSRFGPMQVGYIPGDAAALCDGTAELSLHYKTGRLKRAGWARVQDLVTVPPQDLAEFLSGFPTNVAAPLLAKCLADVLPQRPTARAELIHLRRARQTASCCVVVEVGASLDYPRAIAASLQGADDVSLLLHHADPAATPLLLNLAEELGAIYDLETAVAVPSGPQLLPSERMRAILAAVSATRVLLFAEDALPRGQNWLADWAAQLSDQKRPQLAGAVLLNHDGTIRHAGARISPDGAVDPLQQALNVGDLAASDAAVGDTDLYSGAAIGLNAVAARRLAELPLSATSVAADLSCLARQMSRTQGDAALHGALQAVAHAATPPLPEVLARAEARLIQGSVG